MKLNMEIERQGTNESQMGYFLLPKQHDNTDVIIISDDEEEKATFEPKKKKKKKKKKPKLGFPRNNVDSFDELSKMFQGLPELDEEDNDDLWFSSIYHSEKKDDDKKKYVHVSLDDLGVTVEDLKRIPWEAFDPTWEIRSWARDPWLGGYIQDMFSPPYYSDI